MNEQFQGFHEYPINVAYIEDFMKAVAFELQKNLHNYTELDAITQWGLFWGQNDFNSHLREKQTLNESQAKKYIQQELQLKPQILAIYSYSLCMLLHSGQSIEASDLAIISLNRIIENALGY